MSMTTAERYLSTRLDKSVAELADLPFHVGDELIVIDGVSPEELIKA